MIGLRSIKKKSMLGTLTMTQILADTWWGRRFYLGVIMNIINDYQQHHKYRYSVGAECRLWLWLYDYADNDPHNYRYSVGEDVRINCTSEKTLPPANLTWYINQQPVGDHCVNKFRWQRTFEHLFSFRFLRSKSLLSPFKTQLSPEERWISQPWSEGLIVSDHNSDSQSRVGGSKTVFSISTRAKQASPRVLYKGVKP